MLKPKSSNVLKQIKYEFVHRNRISKDIFVDSNAAKVLSEYLCLELENKDVNGYVQQINQNPFGMLLFSEIQVGIILKLLYTLHIT